MKRSFLNCLASSSLFMALLAQPLNAAAAAPCSALDLGFKQPEAHWAHQALSKLKRDTQYNLVQEDGKPVLRAKAEDSASFYLSQFASPASPFASLSWRWKTDALIEGADNRDKSREDAPLRVILAFDGDVKTLPDAEQRRFKRAKTLTGKAPPYAVLMYIWSEQVALNTIIPSAHSGQVKMLVAQSGKQGLGQWQTLQRDIAADYRLAYGAEPGPLLGVIVMTDTDNTHSKSIGYYSDIRLSCKAD